jgi:hypothetical protein
MPAIAGIEAFSLTTDLKGVVFTTRILLCSVQVPYSAMLH